MPTTLLTSLDATGAGITKIGALTNCSDAGGPFDMGCDLSGTDGLTGTILPGQHKEAECRTAPYQISMAVDFDNAVVQIPTDAQIYRVTVSAIVEYALSGSAIYNKTSGGVGTGATGGSNGYSQCSLSLAVAYTPTSSQITNDIDSDNSGSVATSFSRASSVSNAAAPLERDYLFEPADSNPEAPLGYITRAQLVANFTNNIIVVGAGMDGEVTASGLSNGTYDVNATLLTRVSLWEMRVFWNPGMTISDITPNPAQAGQTVTIEGDGLENIEDLSYHYDDEAGDPQIVAIPSFVYNGITVTFTMPDLGFAGYDQPWPGVLFSGAVELGALDVLYANGSGIYRFVNDKRNDTLYVREDGTTEDVAIPRPFGKTGFIGG